MATFYKKPDLQGASIRVDKVGKVNTMPSGWAGQVQSIFIEDGYRMENLVKLFKMMYGNDAAFVNPTNVVQVAKTMNKMFLEKSH